MLRDDMRGGIALVERLSYRQDREADVSEGARASVNAY